MKLTIVSPEKKIFEGVANSVTVPGTKGAFEILENHAPIISSLQAGKVLISTGDGDVAYDIKSGFVEVARNNVSVCIEL